MSNNSESGYASLGFDSSSSFEHSATNSSTEIQSDEKSTNYSLSLKTDRSHSKMLMFDVKLFGRHRYWETDGRESIINMVKRMLKETAHNSKPKVEFMFFKRMSDEAYLNIGLPTGALQEKEQYECSFKKNLVERTIDKIRRYNEEKFETNWEMKSFIVKLEAGFTFSYLQKFRDVAKLLVDFLPGETLYEALYRDGRFEHRLNNELVICKCDFVTENDKEIFLSVQASNCAQQVLKFQKRRSPNMKLPQKVSPLPEPVQMAGAFESVRKEYVRMTPKKLISETEHDAPQPVAHSTPAPKEKKNLQSYGDLIDYLEANLGLVSLNAECRKKEENKKKGENEKVFKKKYEYFALNFHHRVFLSDLEDILEMKYSIGAIIAVNASNKKQFQGTCFRVGKQYIITNYHIVNNIKQLGIPLGNCFVDFSYKEEDGNYGSFVCDPVLVCSEELDYAIIRLHSDEITMLPHSVIDPYFGFNIAPESRQLGGGESLTFIGYPDGLKKQMDVSCPVEHPEDIQEHLVLALQLLNVNDQNPQAHQLAISKTNSPVSASYNVSTFFEGSSGSPGFLMQEKLLVVLHCRGVPYQGRMKRFAVEKGILMSFIVKDVMKKINIGELQGISLADIFGETTTKNFDPTCMDTDQVQQQL